MVWYVDYIKLCHLCPPFLPEQDCHTKTAPVPFRKRDRSCFSSLHVTIQEGRDLAAGAGGVGIEAAAANAGGDAILDGPSHRLRVVAISVLPVLIEGLLELLTPQNPPLCMGVGLTLTALGEFAHSSSVTICCPFV